MNLNLTTKKIDTDIEIIFVKNKKIKTDKDILELLDFKGEEEQSVLLPELKKLYVGLPQIDNESIKIAVATAIRKLKTTNYKSASIKCKDSLVAFIEGFELGNYSFDKYKSKKDEKEEINIYIEVTEIDKNIQSEFEKYVAICTSVNMVRDFVNTAPEMEVQ